MVNPQTSTPALTLVTDDRSRANQSLFDAHYRTAHTVQIAGIACIDFCESLAAGTGELLLGELTNRSELEIDVVMVNPLCDYARVRAREENNQDLHRDLWQSISKVRMFFDRAKIQEANILGSLSIWLNTNPYFSLFRAVHSNHNNSEMYIGPLLRGKRGERSEWFRGDQQLSTFFDRVGQHFQELYSHGRKLFSCSRHNVQFTSPYDAICSYTKSFEKEAVAFERDAREKVSLTLWFDFNDLIAGLPWIQGFGDAVTKVRNAIVIVGAELGDGQRSELNLLMAQPQGPLMVALFVGDSSTRGATWGAREWNWVQQLPRVEDSFQGGHVTSNTLDRLRRMIVE